MGKMAKRKRKSKKKKNSLAKALESLKLFIGRIPTPPPTKAFKSKKDYKRKNNKEIVERELNDGE